MLACVYKPRRLSYTATAASTYVFCVGLAVVIHDLDVRLGWLLQALLAHELGEPAPPEIPGGGGPANHNKSLLRNFPLVSGGQLIHRDARARARARSRLTLQFQILYRLGFINYATRKLEEQPAARM